MRRIKHESIYLGLILVIIICIFQYGIKKICGFTMYPDEFGYWASAANVVGYDWTEIASLGSYYSFGYSVLLVPLLKLFQGGVAAYRAAIAVNMMLMCAGAMVMRDVVRRLYPEIDGVERALLGAIGVLYPAWIFYMQMTLAEALLMFLFVLITDLFVCFFQKPNAGTAIGLAVTLMYAYSVHMRTIGIVIACLVTLMVWGLSAPAVRRQIVIAIGIAAAAGWILLLIKRNVLVTVFSAASDEVLAINDYSSQLPKIRRLFEYGEIGIFFREIIAKSFYLGAASYGISYWGLAFCLKETGGLCKSILSKKTDSYTLRQWTALFLMLSVVGEVLVCSIFMHGSSTIDSLIYGRYIEFLNPMLIVAGIVAMLKSGKLIRFIVIAGMISGLMTYPIITVIKENNLEGIRGYFVVGISNLIDEAHFDPPAFFRNVWIAQMIMMLLITGIVWGIRRWKNMAWLLAVVIVIEVSQGMQASAHYTYRLNHIAFEDMSISEKILEVGGGSGSITYLDEGMPEYIDFQQMLMPENPIHVLRGNVAEQKDELGDFVLASRDTPQKEVLGALYNRYMMSGTYILYYNQTDE